MYSVFMWIIFHKAVKYSWVLMRHIPKNPKILELCPWSTDSHYLGGRPRAAVLRFWHTHTTIWKPLLHGAEIPPRGLARLPFSLPASHESLSSPSPHFILEFQPAQLSEVPWRAQPLGLWAFVAAVSFPWSTPVLFFSWLVPTGPSKPCSGGTTSGTPSRHPAPGRRLHLFH